MDDLHECECCGLERDVLPFVSRHGVCYCQECYDAGCDLVECEVERRIDEVYPTFKQVMQDYLDRQEVDAAIASIRTAIQTEH